MRTNVHINFTKSGWRQFAKLNRCLGSRFIKGFILRHELAAYISAHENSGVRLDTTCQEIRYDDGIYLLLMKNNGTWYITDIWVTDKPTAFSPVFFWKQIKRGCDMLLVRVLIAWRCVSRAPIESEAYEA